MRLERVLGPMLRLVAGRAPRAFRTVEFDLLPSQSRYASVTCGPESFIFETSDRIIGRILWREGNRFLERLERVLHALGPSFRLETLVEVGANIGIVCIPAVNRGLATRAIVFEPVPGNYRLLQANIVLNGVEDRIVAHRLALGRESSRKVVFELSPDNSGDHRLRTQDGEGLFGEGGRQTIEVPSTRYDDVVPVLDPGSTLLWVEAQGVEGFILEGATQAVERRTPVLVEFAPYLIERSGSRKALELAAAHYSRYLDVGRPESGFQPLRTEALDRTWESLGTRGGYTDLLFC
jgi:FkbM family methyltransferase